jgi:hypothetical protein
MARDKMRGNTNGTSGEIDEQGPRYFVDRELAEARSRSLGVLIASRRCYVCQQADDDKATASSPVASYIGRIVDHCVETADYLAADTPLKEAIFRVILSGGNKPMSPQEISQILSDKWAMTPYPRDVSTEVIHRLLDHSDSYSISRVPEAPTEVEPEEQEEETPAELPADDQ